MTSLKLWWTAIFPAAHSSSRCIRMKGYDPDEAHFTFHGVHAQNYHIFTPADGKDWTMVWGCQPWIKNLPYANAAYNYNFKHGESGKLVLEFYITPFDYAAYEGPERSVESKLQENKIDRAVMVDPRLRRRECREVSRLLEPVT